jgi:hypothetical protein
MTQPFVNFNKRLMGNKSVEHKFDRKIRRKEETLLREYEKLELDYKLSHTFEEWKKEYGK